MDRTALQEARTQRTGGTAAFYIALAYLGAMPYFLLAVDYPSAKTVAARVALVVGNYASMYAVYLATYVFVGIALGVLAFALYDRFREFAPATARVTAAIGLTWSFVLVASGMIYAYGMTTIVDLARTDLAQAHAAWQAIEPVALALGGAGGEILGGLWVLLVSVLALRSGALPKAHAWFGLVIGGLGLISMVPPLRDAAYAFGALQILWLGWLGVVMARKAPAGERRWVAGASAVAAER
ncbi:MAG: DUF4386 family protein [Coriobacteriia bacterium]|nr:DUF4386 family protein [Coriobacteriia bacterium]